MNDVDGAVWLAEATSQLLAFISGSKTLLVMEILTKWLPMSISIQSEEEAWDVLKQLIDGQIRVRSIDEIQLGGWVKSTIYIPENRYDSAMSPYMMKGWIDAQKALFRSYALVSKGAANGRLLTDAEKDQLEIIVTVKSGSSDQQTELNDVLKEVLVGAVDKMDPTTLAIVLIASALIWAGQSSLRSWLDNRKEIKLAESNNAAMIKALSTIETVAQGDKANAEAIQKALEMEPLLEGLKNEADEARHSLVRHASQSDAYLNGVSIPANAAHALTTSSRSSSEDVRKDGVYYIRKVDTTVPDGFRVHLEAKDTGEVFQANVQEVLSSLTDREVIQEAEWSKAPVWLQVNAKLMRNQIVDARVLRADRVEATKPLRDDD